MNANNIRRMRMSAGFSCAALARAVSYRPDTLGRIERGERGLRTELAIKIAEVCKCSVGEVVGVVEATAVDPDGVGTALALDALTKEITRLQVIVGSLLAKIEK
jgi:DNA-binding XRE family transcriptional regulator